MRILLKDLFLYETGEFQKNSIMIEEGVITEIGENLSFLPDTRVYDFRNCFVFPGFTDVHVHLREPGFSYKETILSGSRAGAHGGYTTVCAMPNLDPVPDSAVHLSVETDIIKKSTGINVLPYGAITKDENGKSLSDMDDIADRVVAFSDDGKGVQDDALMLAAMKKAKILGKIIASHCEDERFVIKDAIKPLTMSADSYSESEWRMIERDIKLAKETGCAYHVCHVSAGKSVELIRQAKKDGVDITCETAPHYIVLCDSDIRDSGRFKMNPPLRTQYDRQAVLQGLCDGTIDMIATDHAPHSYEEKSHGYKGSLNGIVGLETAFSVLYTNLVRQNIMPLEKLVELMSKSPNQRFNIGKEIKIGEKADLTVFDLEKKYIINSDDFLSKGKSTPFEGLKVYGKCLLTMAEGEIVWEEK